MTAMTSETMTTAGACASCSDDCGCCAGVAAITPEPIDNPPGRPALAYRIGTYGTFFRTMMARLGVLEAEAGTVGGPAAKSGDAGCLGESHRTFLLGGEPDAGTALIDGFACVADVLTFYQERIANEGFLRTATEQRSVVELGRLTGYEPRPGVAASAHLAFSVLDTFDGQLPAHTKVQSTPRPGQTAQVFETSEVLDARVEWSAMRVQQRATTEYIRREMVTLQDEGGEPFTEPTRRIEIFLAGNSQNVQVGDVVIVEHSQDGSPPIGSLPSKRDVYRVSHATFANELAHTTLRLAPLDGDWIRGGEWDDDFATPANGSPSPASGPFSLQPAPLRIAIASRARLLAARDVRRSAPAAPAAIASPAALAKPATVEAALGALWAKDPEALIALAGPGMPQLRERLRAVLRTAPPAPAPRAWVLRTSAQVFGHNAPELPTITPAPTPIPTPGLILLSPPATVSPQPSPPVSPPPAPVTPRAVVHAAAAASPPDRSPEADETADVAFLDGGFSGLRIGSWLVMSAPLAPDPDGNLVTQIFEIEAADVQSRRAYGLSGKTTRVALSRAWWAPTGDSDGGEGSDGGSTDPAPTITAIRRTVVYAQPEPLKLVGEPIELPVSGSRIDLDRVVTPLPPGRQLIVEGDLAGTSGVRVAELVRVAAAGNSLATVATALRLRTPTADDPADAGVLEATPDGAATPAAASFTQITLTTELRNTYQRGSVVIRGNVAHATHGETRDEVLGSGDASIPRQAFTLRQGPRTWISAPTPSGIASTLAVRVSGILWPEVRSAAFLGPRDEVVRTRTLGDGRDEISGGDGRNGARFPTGVENLTARYRVGIGAPGNVGAGLINALITRPMGVRDVINPLRASGGADPDGRDDTRARIPIAARAIDRIVSVSDHADFAMNFAGVDKAIARFEPGPIDGLSAGQPVVRVVIAGAEDEPIEADSDLLANLRTALRLEGDPTLPAVITVATATPLTLRAKVRIDPRHEFSLVEPALRDRLIAKLGWDVRAIGDAAHLSVVLEALQSVDGVISIDVDVFGPLRSSALAAARAAAAATTAATTSATAAAAADAAATRQIADRVAGLLERLAEAGGPRQWRFAAGPDEVLYFSRSLPDAVVFQEMT